MFQGSGGLCLVLVSPFWSLDATGHQFGVTMYGVLVQPPCGWLDIDTNTSTSVQYYLWRIRGKTRGFVIDFVVFFVAGVGWVRQLVYAMQYGEPTVILVCLGSRCEGLQKGEWDVVNGKTQSKVHMNELGSRIISTVTRVRVKGMADWWLLLGRNPRDSCLTTIPVMDQKAHCQGHSCSLGPIARKSRGWDKHSLSQDVKMWLS